MGDVLVLVVTVALIALSAFFVAVEFALLAARRHRLAEEAATSRSARAALRSSQELTVLLAGSQLGITVCTLALGAVTKPAVHHWLTPVIEGWGAPAWVADASGFVLALVVVTFLHLVVGEMAPKSWAIAHPERSAIMLALPMRAFMAVSRPLLVVLNEAANVCLRRVGVEPVDEAVSGRDPQTLRHLVEHSAEVGTLDAGDSGRLTEALALAELTLGELVRDGALTTVPVGARARDVREAALRTRHLRILLADGDAVTGLVHVRDTLPLADDEPVAAVARPDVREPADAPVQGIETLALRLDRISDNATAVAQHLKHHPQVSWVNYAGLEDHPDHGLVRKYLSGKASGIVTFGVKGGREQGARFLDALQLFTRLVNIGDVRSLATHPASTTHRQLSPAELDKAGVGEDTVRLSIGIEHIDDLKADLDQALAAL